LVWASVLPKGKLKLLIISLQNELVAGKLAAVSQTHRVVLIVGIFMYVVESTLNILLVLE
jgi:hypothetical protein